MSGEARSAVRSAGLYVLLAYGISWGLLIPMIKEGLQESWLNIGVAGPAIAAMILSRRESGWRFRLNVGRLGLLVGATALCWIALCWHEEWMSSGPTALRFHLWLLVPSLVPAWILSGAASGDSGARDLIRRLVHKPTWWSVSPLVCWPVFLLVPAGSAYLLHQPLTLPKAGASSLVTIVQGAGLLAYNVLFVAVEEEPGWRGFMLDKLQTRYSPLVSSMIVWLPWSLWHGPLDYFRPVHFSPAFWILLRLVMPIPLNILLAWFYNRSGRSIQATAMFHASMNTFPLLLPNYQPAFALLFFGAGYAVVNGRMWRTPVMRRPEFAASVD